MKTKRLQFEKQQETGFPDEPLALAAQLLVKAKATATAKPESYLTADPRPTGTGYC